MPNEVQNMSIDELHTVGEERRERDIKDGWDPAFADRMLEKWIEDLEMYWDLHKTIGDALRRRLFA